MPESTGYEEAVLSRIGDQLDPMADAVAGSMGMPPGGQRYSMQQQLDEWSYSPIADPEARIETMLTLKGMGRTNEEITDAVYPNRRRLIETGRPRIQDQIRYAEQMDREMGKQARAMLEAGTLAPPYADRGLQAEPPMAPSPDLAVPIDSGGMVGPGLPPAPGQEMLPAPPPAPSPAPPANPLLDVPFSASGG